MKTLKHYLIGLLIGFAAFAIILSVPSSIGATETEMETLKMGVLLSFSGGYGPWGHGCNRGFEVMADKINEEGGIKVGDKRYRIELVKSDNKSDFNVALAGANRLIFQNGINYILGPMMSGATLAVQPVTEKNKVLTFCFSYSPKVLGAEKKYSFRLFPAGSENMKAIFMYISKHHPDLKTVGSIGPNDETGWGTAKAVKSQADKYGLQHTFKDFFQRGTDDFFPILTRLMTKNPDILIPHSVPPPSMALLLKQKHQMGYKGIIISPSHFDPTKLSAKAGKEAIEGLIHQAPDIEGPLATDGHRELHKRYMEKYKDDFIPVSASAYPYLWYIKMAIEKAGTLETTAVAEAMRNLKGEGPYGPVTMGGLKTYGSNSQIVEPIFMSIIKDGKNVGLQPVTPPVP
jgi:branched-chain amino acid transport system substrate-binding protein